MNETDAWLRWRAVQPEADDRDLDARKAHASGYAAGHETHARPWYEALSAVLICALVLAAICYVLAGTPH